MGINAKTLKETQDLMLKKLKGLVPEVEIKAKSELVFEINELKREMNAVILGHNYMESALFHTVPDHVGDSLGLSRIAARAEGDIIVFCGVEFMAETAKILNPNKTVLLPATKAGCSLAESITGEDVRKLRAKYPGLPVVTYVNCSAEVKAETDICCTSSNAVDVVKSLNSEQIIFLPDEYLAKNVAIETGMTLTTESNDTLDKKADTKSQIIAWHGKCEVHEQFTVSDIVNIKKQYPNTLVVTHPESHPDVVAASDFSSGTSKMIDFVKKTEADHYLILTECSMGDNIIAENPEKDILRMCSIRCPHMNQITLEGVLHSLRHNEKEIFVDKDIQVRAKKSVDRMLEIG